MFTISNRQYGEVIELLSDYLTKEVEGESLRQQNRYRRARLLLKALRKRNPIGR